MMLMMDDDDTDKFQYIKYNVIVKKICFYDVPPNTEPPSLIALARTVYIYNITRKFNPLNLFHINCMCLFNKYLIFPHI